MTNSAGLPLRDIHLPEAVGFWPLALGWWLLAIVLLLSIVSIVLLIRRLRRKTAWKAAKQALTELRRDPTLDEAEKLRRLSVLMRRSAISFAPRAESAGLTGNAWLAYLDRTLPDKPFTGGIGRCLLDAPYRQHAPSIDLSELFSVCERWLKAQRRQAR